MSRLFYILKKKSLIFAYNATAIAIRVMGCIDAKKISPDCPSGNFQENMHSLRKVYFCVEKLTFSIHLNLPLYEYLWQTTTDSRGRRAVMPGGWFCSVSCADSRSPSRGAGGGADPGDPDSKLVRFWPVFTSPRVAHGFALFPGEQESSAAGVVVLESSVDLSVFVRLHPPYPPTSVP